jgi:hypothetical protein
LGGSLETAQSINDNIAFAWDLGVFWTLPSSFDSRLSLTGHFAGGNTGDGTIGAFVPVTGKPYGSILKAKLSGISILDLDYIARLTRTFGTSLTTSFFVRNDRGTYRAYPVNPNDNTGYFLGTELFARLVWSPFSDLQLNLGGGVFLPSPDVNPNAKPGGCVELTAILALY